MRALPDIYAHLEGRRAEGMGICRQIPSAHVISDIAIYHFRHSKSLLKH